VLLYPSGWQKIQAIACRTNMEKQGIRLFNTLKLVSLPGDTIIKGYEGNHLPQLGATDLFTQEAKITAAEPQVPAIKLARIPCTRHRG
jgi:hypothetical protein